MSIDANELACFGPCIQLRADNERLESEAAEYRERLKRAGIKAAEQSAKIEHLQAQRTLHTPLCIVDDLITARIAIERLKARVKELETCVAGFDGWGQQLAQAEAALGVATGALDGVFQLIVDQYSDDRPPRSWESKAEQIVLDAKAQPALTRQLKINEAKDAVVKAAKKISDRYTRRDLREGSDLAGLADALSALALAVGGAG